MGNYKLSSDAMCSNRIFKVKEGMTMKQPKGNKEAELQDKKKELINKGEENLSTPPSAEYLEKLQQDAIQAMKNLDATEGEKVIRQGLQAWPELIDQELQKFKAGIA